MGIRPLAFEICCHGPKFRKFCAMALMSGDPEIIRVDEYQHEVSLLSGSCRDFAGTEQQSSC